MVLSKSELYRKAAGYMLAAANAGIREEKKNLKKIIVKTLPIGKNKKEKIKK